MIDADDATAQVVCGHLELHGYAVRRAATGSEATQIAALFHPDLVLLDPVLPDVSGFDLCDVLCRRGAAGIIMLTVLGQKDDKLRAFSLGADDFITKPCDIDELVARVKAVIRRIRRQGGSLTLGDVTIDVSQQRGRNADRTIYFTRRECELLKYLAERADSVVSRDELLRNVWGFHEEPLTRAVDHAVVRLRKKIEPNPHHPVFLHAVHAEGYCLTPFGGRPPEGQDRTHGTGGEPGCGPD